MLADLQWGKLSDYKWFPTCGASFIKAPEKPHQVPEKETLLPPWSLALQLCMQRSARQPRIFSCSHTLPPLWVIPPPPRTLPPPPPPLATPLPQSPLDTTNCYHCRPSSSTSTSASFSCPLSSAYTLLHWAHLQMNLQSKFCLCLQCKLVHLSSTTTSSCSSFSSLLPPPPHHHIQSCCHCGSSPHLYPWEVTPCPPA